jgi:hypothetical protein
LQFRMKWLDLYITCSPSALVAIKDVHCVCIKNRREIFNREPRSALSSLANMGELFEQTLLYFFIYEQKHTTIQPLYHIPKIHTGFGISNILSLTSLPQACHLAVVLIRSWSTTSSQHPRCTLYYHRIVFNLPNLISRSRNILGLSSSSTPSRHHHPTFQLQLIVAASFLRSLAQEHHRGIILQLSNSSSL